jgi:hypothetical protein
MAITPEELEQITSSEDYTKHELIKPLLDAGFVIRTNTHYEEALNNYATDKIKASDRNAYTLVEQEILEATGVEKQPNEKATEYMKRAYGVTKETVSKFETELNELKEKRTDGDATKADKQRITQLESLLNEQKQTYQTQLQDALDKANKASANGIIDASMVSIMQRLDKNVPSNIMQEAANNRLSSFKAAYTLQQNADGSTVVVDRDGKELLDTAGTYKPLTVAQVMEQHFSDLMHKEQNAQGAGGKGSTQGTGALTIPSEIRTMVQLTTYLKQKGFAAGSTEFAEYYNYYVDKLEFR